jgi:hypothetical protein
MYSDAYTEANGFNIFPENTYSGGLYDRKRKEMPYTNIDMEILSRLPKQQAPQIQSYEEKQNKGLRERIEELEKKYDRLFMFLVILVVVILLQNKTYMFDQDTKKLIYLG